MSQSKNNLNEEWRKVFEEASETPPPSVWDAIEKHLNEQSKVPLAAPWWAKPQAWLAAASVLLVLGIGSVLFLNRTSQTDGNLSERTALTKEKSPAEATGQTIPLSTGAAPSSEPTSSTPPAAVASASPEKSADSADEKAQKHHERTTSDRVAENRKLQRSQELASDQAENKATVASQKNNLTPKAIAAAGVDDRIEDTNIAGARLAATELALLEPASYNEIETHWQTRYVFFNPYLKEETAEPIAKPESSPLWAGVSVMPGGFNPNMQFSHQNVYQMNNAVGPSAMYNTSGFNARNRDVTGNRDQPKMSYQAAAQMGVNLSKNWSLESGIAFLQGNATSRSPGYVVNKANQQSADLLANALVAGNSAQYSRETFERLQFHGDAANAMAVYVPLDQNMQNSYSFLQVPAYLGYTFAPENKFSYTLLGGGVTNFFLQNTLQTASGYTLKTTPENNVYNNVAVAAGAGLRVSYRLSNTWNTNLTANYQHALMTSFKDNQFLRSHPQVYGISWGVRYTFQR